MATERSPPDTTADGTLSFPFAVGNDARFLVIESSPAFLSQSEGPGPLRDLINSDPLACLVEVGVTGLDNRPVEIHGTMPTFFPVTELTIAEVIVAGIRDSAFGLQNTFFQPRNGHDDLKSGTGRILTLNCPVAQRSEPIFHQCLPLVGFDSPRKNIGVKGRRANHREDSAGIDVKRNDGSFLTLERFEGGLLKLAIQR